MSDKKNPIKQIYKLSGLTDEKIIEILNDSNPELIQQLCQHLDNRQQQTQSSDDSNQTFELVYDEDTGMLKPKQGYSYESQFELEFQRLKQLLRDYIKNLSSPRSHSISVNDDSLEAASVTQVELIIEDQPCRFNPDTGLFEETSQLSQAQLNDTSTNNSDTSLLTIDKTQSQHFAQANNFFAPPRQQKDQSSYTSTDDYKNKQTIG